MTCEVHNKEINSQCAELLVRPLYILYEVMMLPYARLYNVIICTGYILEVC